MKPLSSHSSNAGGSPPNYASLIITVLGLTFSLASAVSPWVSTSFVSVTLFSTPSVSLLTSGALLLVSFVFGLVSLLCQALPMCWVSCCTPPTPTLDVFKFALSLIAFLTALGGTVLGASGEVVPGSGATLASTVAGYSAMQWGGGFGCGIVAVVFQAAAFVLTARHSCCAFHSGSSGSTGGENGEGRRGGVVLLQR
jgi:hypothetical protein